MTESNSTKAVAFDPEIHDVEKGSTGAAGQAGSAAPEFSSTDSDEAWENSNELEPGHSSSSGNHDNRIRPILPKHHRGSLLRRAALVFKDKSGRPLNQRSLREMVFVVCAGVCLSFNSGYINGCCVSGLLSPSGSISQGVSAFTGTYTKSGLALADGNVPLFGFEFSMILSFIAGAFVSGLINPKAVPHQLGPMYGPTFIVGSVLLFIASILSSYHPEGRTYFFFAAAANGLQNGMSSMYSANLIRTTHLTGTSTDIGLFLGQMARGNKTNQWKCFVLIGLAVSFWLGSLISLYAASRLRGLALLFNACFFLFIGICSVMFVVVTQHISIMQAATGKWQWDVALDSLDIDKNKFKGGKLDEKAMDIFDNIDIDGDGFIEESELFVALKATGMHVTDKSVKSMLMVADEDGDGFISKDEFRNFVKQQASKKSLMERASKRFSRKSSVTSNASDNAEN